MRLTATRPVGARLSAGASSAIRDLPRQQPGAQRRAYNFASSSYTACFGVPPATDEHMAGIRAETIKFIEAFDHDDWHRNPVVTVINGDRFPDGEVVETVDAFEKSVGKMVLAPANVVDQVIAHVAQWAPKDGNNDLRVKVRQVEERLMSVHVAKLIGNQAMDFHKQDGITEIEESLQANEVERQLNDALFADELAGKIAIRREPALVGCVSNFSNFLDLCRKCLRNLELGVPVIVLSRSNTTQHMFRWFELLEAEFVRAGLDTGMLTYAACSIDEQRRIMQACPDSPLYLTGSRPVAASIKELVPATFSSTGGPNTMVTTKMTDEIKQAIRWSVAIENSGQCTAMRHLVAPNVDEKFVDELFEAGTVPTIDTSLDSLKVNGFAGFFTEWAGSFEQQPGYKRPSNGDVPLAFKVSDNLPYGIDEGWRRMYLDVTSAPSAEAVVCDEYVDNLSEWLVTEQPITLSINGDEPGTGYPVASKLFERTCQVVYSVGTDTNPSLTCQARPQEGEIFGEFPPRRDLATYTKFPVIVPSPTAGYHTTYTDGYLAAQAAAPAVSWAEDKLRARAGSTGVAGYLHTLAEYLADAANGPRPGYSLRTTLWGLQRPPLRTTPSGLQCTELRLDAGTDVDSALIHLLPFAMTNARDQLSISVDSTETLDAVAPQWPNVTVESEAQFEGRVSAQKPWNVIRPEAFAEYPLVGHFVSLNFPLGHIKSTKSDDQEFVTHFEQSAKWLRCVPQGDRNI